MMKETPPDPNEQRLRRIDPGGGIDARRVRLIIRACVFNNIRARGREGAEPLRKRNTLRRPRRSPETAKAAPEALGHLRREKTRQRPRKRDRTEMERPPEDPPEPPQLRNAAEASGEEGTAFHRLRKDGQSRRSC